MEQLNRENNKHLVSKDVVQQYFEVDVILDDSIMDMKELLDEIIGCFTV